MAGRSRVGAARSTQADVMLALDSDLLELGAGSCALCAAISPAGATRCARSMSRVYAVEATPTLIGAAADHRFIARARPSCMAAVAGVAPRACSAARAPADAPGWVAPVVADLEAAQGRAFVHAGPDLPAEAHALVHAVNEALGGARQDL